MQSERDGVRTWTHSLAYGGALNRRICAERVGVHSAERKVWFAFRLSTCEKRMSKCCATSGEHF